MATATMLNGTKEARAMRVTLWVTWLVLGLLAVLAVAVYIQGQQWDPLGEYPEQRAISDNLVGTIPAFHLGEPITVEGTKCNDTDKPVAVTGTLVWKTESPPGTVLTIASEGGDVRQPGCVTETFANPIPPEVTFATLDLVSTFGLETVQWRITGTETPVSQSGRADVPRVWQTEPFFLSP